MWGLVSHILIIPSPSILLYVFKHICTSVLLSFFFFSSVISHRTYADKLSPKVVQSLLDLLCSQLKNLLSQAGVLLMASFGEGEEDEEEEKKLDSSGETEKRDFRGITNLFLCCL